MTFCFPGYLAKNFRICYNADRQKDISIHGDTKQKPLSLDHSGAFAFVSNMETYFFLPNGIIAYAENLFKIPFGRKEML